MSPGFAGVEPRLFRKKRNLWLAYGSEIASPLLELGARLRSRGARKPRSDWRRGLIISHTHIGDILYRTCSLPALREHLPDCKWTYLTSSQSVEVLENNPHISETLPLVKGENSWELVDGGFSALAKRKFDVVLCSNTLRHYPDLALASALGIPERFGFTGKGLSGLINNPVPMEFPQAYAAYFQKMVGTAIGRMVDGNLHPRLYPRDEHAGQAAELWNSFGFDGTVPVVACSVRTRQASGNWPDEVMMAVLEDARARLDFEIVLCGVGSDEQYLKSFAAQLRYPAHILAGEAGLLAFAAFLSKCTALLTLDSGPRHIGNAVGIPVLFARNLSHSMVEAGSYCANEIDLAPPVEYLDDVETERVARSQPVGLLADKLIDVFHSRGWQ